MRAIFGLSPAQAAGLPASEWFALAYRLPYYPGVLRAKVLARQESSSISYGDGRKTSRFTGDGARKVPATRSAILADPELSAVVSFGGG